MPASSSSTAAAEEGEEGEEEEDEEEEKAAATTEEEKEEETEETKKEEEEKKIEKETAKVKEVVRGGRWRTGRGALETTRRNGKEVAVVGETERLHGAKATR